MSFERNLLSLRIYRAAKEFRPDDIVPKLAKPLCAFPAAGLESICGDSSAIGFAGGSHPTDVPIVPENSLLGGYLHVHLTEAKRKIPAAVFQDAMGKEKAAFQKQGRPLRGRALRDVQKETRDRLIQDAPPCVRAAEICAGNDGWVYSTGISLSFTQILSPWFIRETDIGLAPMTPESLASLWKVDTRELTPTNFATGEPTGDHSPGCEFLTWLMCMIETGADLGHRIMVGMDGPLSFQNGESETCRNLVVKDGNSILSSAATSALRAGMKLRKCRLMLVDGDKVWNCLFDAADFTIKSLKLPAPVEMLDPVSNFQERMDHITRFRTMLFELYNRFMALRSLSARWVVETAQIKEWIEARRGRA